MRNAPQSAPWRPGAAQLIILGRPILNSQVSAIEKFLSDW